jgi:hypothetical protein
MCTTHLQRVDKQLVGWKAVLVDQKRKLIVSYYKDFFWKAQKTHRAKGNVFTEQDFVDGIGLFHCFARRSDARRFKRLHQTTYSSLKIIKLQLSGKTFVGRTDGMGNALVGLPATLGTKAYWDGTFHR